MKRSAVCTSYAISASLDKRTVPLSLPNYVKYHLAGFLLKSKSEVFNQFGELVLTLNGVHFFGRRPSREAQTHDTKEGDECAQGPTDRGALLLHRSENMFGPHVSEERSTDFCKEEDIMICVAVTYLILPGHEEEAIELFATLTQQTNAEPLNLFYLVHHSLTEPRRFFIYEQYTDQAALDTHRASPHLVQYVTNGLFLILEKREAEIYVPLP